MMRKWRQQWGCGLLGIAAFLGLESGAAAQKIITVDEGGTGDYVDIQSAVDAAGPNDIIRISRGTYDGATISKGLRLLGATPILTSSGTSDRRVYIDGLISVTGLAQNETVAISDLSTSASRFDESYPLLLSVSNCQGSVHLAYIHRGSASIVQSKLVTGFSSSFGNGFISDSRVIITDSNWMSSDRSQTLTVIRSHITLIDSLVSDLTPNPFGQPEAVLLTDSTLIYAGESFIIGGGYVPSIQNSDSRVIEHSDERIALDTKFLDRIAVDLEDVPGDASVVALAYGSPLDPATISHGGLHIDPGTLRFLYLGPKPQTPKLRKFFPLPAELYPSRHHQTAANGFRPFPSSILLGVPIVFQAALLVGGDLSLSMPYTMLF